MYIVFQSVQYFSSFTFSNFTMVLKLLYLDNQIMEVQIK